MDTLVILMFLVCTNLSVNEIGPTKKEVEREVLQIRTITPMSTSLIQTSQKCKASVVKNQIRQLGNMSEKTRRHIIRSIVSKASICKNGVELKELVDQSLSNYCGSSDAVALSQDFRAFEGIVEVVSRLKYSPSIDILVGCVNQSSIISGLSASRFPARLALIELGEKAVPKIAIGLSGKQDEIKCALAELLVEIGGMRAKSVLEEGLQSEINVEVRKCFHDAIGLIR